MGFYNFVFSIPFAFLTLGYFWNRRGHFMFSQAVILNLLLLVVYLGHMITYLVVLGSIAFIAVIYFISQWRSLHGNSHQQHVTSLSISLLSLMPTLSILVSYYLNSNSPIAFFTLIPGTSPTYSNNSLQCVFWSVIKATARESSAL